MQLLVFGLHFHSSHLLIDAFQEGSEELLRILLGTAGKPVLSPAHLGFELRRTHDFLLSTASVGIDHLAIGYRQSLLAFPQLDLPF
jgi:hypothetical protein